MLLKLGLHGFAGLGGGHLFVSDDVLELEIILDDEAGGHQVVVVDVLDEGLQSALSIELLLAHGLGDLAGSALNTDNEGVTELLVLHHVQSQRV